MTLREFLFNDSHWLDIVGWHVSLAVVFGIAWQLSKWVHKK